MDFAWTPEQAAYREQVLAFARERLVPCGTDADEDGTFAHENWRRCAEFGIQALSVPREYAGHEPRDFPSAMLAMETLGEVCRDNGLTFALNAHTWTVAKPIAEYGSDAQKRRFLPPMCRGEWIGAHAMTESDSGSDAFSLATRARPVTGGYLLNGVKRYVSLAPVAHVALVFATVDPAHGKWGVTAFLVELDRDGVTVGPTHAKMGLRTVPMGDLYFEDCHLPEENRLGREGAGLSLSSGFLEWERCAILASQLGAMHRQLDEAVARARTREQFGQPIGRFQSVSNRVVDMKLRLETSRLLLYKAAWLKESGASAMIEIALLKLHLSESFVASSLDAIRLHGAHGYLSEALVERDLRDAVAGVIYAGTSDIQRNVVARLLGL